MIYIKGLKEADIGRWVTYKGELGRIKHWNERYIFVVYKCSGKWTDYQRYTAVATKPKDLSFIEPGDPRVKERGE